MPVSLEQLANEPERAEAARPFAEVFNVQSPPDLTGDWWGVISPGTREFQTCPDQASAVELGMRRAQQAKLPLWLEPEGHGSARLIADYSEQD